MKNLLKADFFRLIKYKPFIIIGSMLVLFSVYLNYCFNIDLKYTSDYYIHPFDYFVYISFITSTFVSFFAGINFTDGIIRNKLFCGHSKTKIYLSNAIICAVASAIFTLVFSTSGIWLVANNRMDIASFLVFSLICVIVTISFSAIASFFTFIIRGKAIPIVASAMIIIGMFLATNNIGEKLAETEYTEVIDTIDGKKVNEDNNYEFYAYTADSKITYKTIKNPFFIPDGAKRTVMETVFKLLPTSNLYYTMTMVISADSPERVQAMTSDFDQRDISSTKDVLDSMNVIYNIITLAAFTLAGVYIFKREDIK